MTYYSTEHMTPIGSVTLASDGIHLVGLWNAGQKYHGASVPGPTTARDDLAVFGAAKEWLDLYFSGGRPQIGALPLSPMGSAFRQTVWRLLMEIPYGQVISYGELAKRLARTRGTERMSAQAVGGAVGHNPISIVIPCHRVVGANGSLTGYAGGLEKKLSLLKHEGCALASLFVPTKGTAL